jgi:PAS domain S-box-containing protein
MINTTDEAQYLNTILNNSLNGIMALRAIRDSSGNIIDFEWMLANPRVGEILNRDAQDLIGKRLLDELPGSIPAGLFERYVEVIQNHETIEFEHFYPYDNLEVWLRTMIVKVDDGLVITFADITQRKMTEYALELRHAELEKFFMLAQDLLCISDLEGNFINLNKAWETVLGYKIEDLIGHNLMDFVHPDDLKESLSVIDLLESDGVVLNFTNRYRHQNGTYCYLEWRAYLDGGLIYVAARDITGRIEAEKRKLDRRLEQERMELLQKFIQNAAHEFRTPLSVIGSSAFLMRKSDDEERRQRYLTQVQAQIERMTKLVDMLTFAVRLDQNPVMMLEDVNLHTLFTRLVNILPKEGAEVVLKLAPDTPNIRGNADYLNEAMMQILDNARRFSPADSVVMIRVQPQDGDMVRICVQDSGVGISDSTKEQIFDAFWRQDEAHTTPGFGLGLTIAKKIINLHHGAIQVESVDGQGSTFQVYLPIDMR